MVWSDMFDPNHNAVRGLLPRQRLARRLVGGPGPPRSIIANWNGGKAKASLDFFADRGHPQVIAGYYDGDDNFKTWDAAARGVPKVIGFMYTTWQDRYDDLERYGKAMRGEE